MTTNNTHRPRRGACVLTAAALVCLAAPSMATSSTPGTAPDLDTSVAETVQVVMSADGDISTRRMYTQVSATGQGNLHLDVPSPEVLRDLNGFGAPTVENGRASYQMKVDGTAHSRTVADYDKALPVTVDVTYTLDGRQVDAADIVGKSGLLEVGYHIENDTAAERTVTYVGGDGKDVTENVKTVMPLVGSMSMTLPGSFANLSAPDATLGGNGRGGTQVQWSLILFDPVGSPTADVGYSAYITDGELPAVKLQLAVVAPEGMAATRNAGKQYQTGAQTGANLATGAATIDENLLKLQDGAGKLLSGLEKLRAGAVELESGLSQDAVTGAQAIADGADELAAGLNDKALPGANQVADGAAELSKGLNDQALPGAKKLADGADELASGLKDKALPGARQVSTGAKDLSAGLNDQIAPGAAALSGGAQTLKSGAKDLSDGLTVLSDGLGTLNGKLPAAAAGVQALIAGTDKILAGLGTEGEATTLIGGAHALETGLVRARDGVAASKGGVDQVRGGIQDSIAPGGAIDQLAGAVSSLNGYCAADPVCQGTIAAITAKINGPVPDSMKSRSTAAADGLGQVSGGLGQVHQGLADPSVGAVAGAGRLKAGLHTVKTGVSNPAASGPADAGLRQGLGSLLIGLNEAVDGVDKLATGAQTANMGGKMLSTGASTLSDGASTLSTGIGTAAAGSKLLADGSQQLTDGLAPAVEGSAKLADGSKQLRDGLAPAAEGSAKLADGSKQLADGLAPAAEGSAKLAEGSGQLVDGLGNAADGAGQIADGLGQAAPGAEEIESGAGRLSEEGTKQLVAAGEETAASYGSKYGQIVALNERAAESRLAYGNAENASAQSTVFAYELAGANDQGQENLIRALGAALTLAAGAGIAVASRRRKVA